MVAYPRDERSPERRDQDIQIASEPELMPLDLQFDSAAVAVESHLAQLSHPVAVAGVVENGVIHLLDPSICLPEHSRVIIVASEHS